MNSTRNANKLLTYIQICFSVFLLYAFYTHKSFEWWLLSIGCGYVLFIIGFSIGYHHIVSHKSIDLGKFGNALTATIGFIGTVYSPFEWAIAHVPHHLYCDAKGDPHSQHVIGWKVILFKYYDTSKCNIMYGKKVLESPYLRFLSEYPTTLILAYWSLTFIVLGYDLWIQFVMLPTFFSVWFMSIAAQGQHEPWAKTTGKPQATDSLFWNIVLIGGGNHAKHHVDPTHVSGLALLLKKVFN